MKHTSLKIALSSLAIYSSLLPMSKEELTTLERELQSKTSSAEKTKLLTTARERELKDTHAVAIATRDLGLREALNSTLGTIQTIINTKTRDDILAKLLAGCFSEHVLLYQKMSNKTHEKDSDADRYKWLKFCITIYFPEKPVADFLPCYIDVKHIAVGRRDKGVGGHIVVCQDQYLEILKKYARIEIDKTTKVRYAPSITEVRTLPSGKTKNFRVPGKSFYPLPDQLVKVSSLKVMDEAVPMDQEQQVAVAPFIQLIMAALRDGSTLVAKRDSTPPGSSSRIATTQQRLTKLSGLTYYIEIILKLDEGTTDPSPEVVTAYPIFNMIEWQPDTTFSVVNSGVIATGGPTHSETLSPDDFDGPPTQHIMTSDALRNLIRTITPEGKPLMPLLYTYMNGGVERAIYDIAPALASRTIAKEIVGKETPTTDSLTVVENGIYVSIPTSELP